MIRAGSTVFALAVAVIGLGCQGDDDGSSPASAYLREPTFRRAQLVASQVNPANGYSSLRLQHYATGTDGDWDRLPSWNPPVSVVAVAELDDATAPREAARPLPVTDETRLPPPADLRALGEAAFFRYPAQLAPAMATGLTRATAVRYGFWLDDARGVGGLVRAQLAGGDQTLALTCATCHAGVSASDSAGRVVPGLPSGSFDLGRLLVDAGADDARAGNLLLWGPGRVDVTTGDASLPERISDLRPLRFLSHLQYDATVRQESLVSLAIRVETLLITAHAQAIRPPRVVALAIAEYLWSLADAMPAPPPGTDAGATLFAARCAGCHAGDGFTGAPQPLEVVGTDPTLGRSPDRGTGFYRVPSLRGVSARPTLLHNGSVRDLAAMLDPARTDADYRGGARGDGPIPGHPFGLDLPAADRAALLAYLRAL